MAACGGGGADATTGPTPTPGPGPSPLTISVSAAASNVPAAGTVGLTATLVGGTVSEVGAGVLWRASGGTLTPSGTSATLIAPAQGGPITVTALSVADSTRRASTTISVTPVQLAFLAPATNRLPRSVRLAEPLRAVVTGAAAGRDSVAWTATCGTITPRDATGADYDAPATPGSCTVTARSTLDTTVSAQQELVVRNAWLVTTLEDDGNHAAPCTAARCTIRAALAQASTTPEPDTLVLGDAQLGVPLRGAMPLVAPLPAVESPVHLEGPGADSLAIDANASDADPRNVFVVSDGGVLSIEHLTLRGGVAPVTGGGAIAVGAFGRLALRDVVLRDNRAPERQGGGLYVGNRGEAVLERVLVLGNSARDGGGVSVDNDGVLTMTDSRLVENIAEGRASSGGGGLHTINAYIVVSDVVVERNRAALGGGVNVTSSPGLARTTQLTRLTLRDNVATSTGGGLRITGGVGAQVAELTITGNRANTAGGASVTNSNDLLLTSTRIAGQHDSTATIGGLLISGGSVTARDVVIEDNVVTGGTGGVSLSGGAAVAFERVAIRRNRAATTGGVTLTASASLDMRGGEISRNTATGGTAGGVMIGGNAVVVLDDVTVADNATLTTGGGIFHGLGSLTITRSRITGNTAASNGGAVYSTGQDSLRIEGSTFADNASQVNGGALFVFGGAIRNSTFSGNRAAGGGTAIVAMSGISLTNVTVADHRVIGAGNGTAVLFAAGTSSSVTNSLFARNRRGDETPGNCGVSGGSVVSGGHNLSDDATCAAFTAAGDRVNVSAALADSLADNGGPTPTYLLLASSPAVNGGLASACSTHDQRGAPRVDVCDIGATEFGASVRAPARTTSKELPQPSPRITARAEAAVRDPRATLPPPGWP